MPKILYTFEGTIHRYCLDMYIPKDNLIIEVKSKYTLLKYSNQNKAKFETTLALGYNFKLKIYDEKGNIVKF